MVCWGDTPSGVILSSRLTPPVPFGLRLEVRPKQRLRIHHPARTAASVPGQYLGDAPFFPALPHEVDRTLEPARHLFDVKAVAVVALVLADDTVESRRDRRL